MHENGDRDFVFPLRGGSSKNFTTSSIDILRRFYSTVRGIFIISPRYGFGATVRRLFSSLSITIRTGTFGHRDGLAAVG